MIFDDIIKWLNNNQGLLSLLLFACSIVFAWISGIFRALIRKPKFKIRVIPKMTFGVIYLTGEKYTPPRQGTYDVHKTAFVVYLEIINIGSAPSDIGKIKIGYYRDNGGKTLFQKRLWITETTILANFSIPTGDGQVLSIPHLKQVNFQLEQDRDCFLEVGKSAIGAVYFEQSPRWGNHYPRQNKDGNMDIKICIKDAFDNTYSSKVSVPVKTLEEAMRYNPRFGLTESLFDKDHIVDKKSVNEKEHEGGIQNKQVI